MRNMENREEEKKRRREGVPLPKERREEGRKVKFLSLRRSEKQEEEKRK